MKKMLSILTVCAIAALLAGAAQDTKPAEEPKPNLAPQGYAWVALRVNDLSEAGKFFAEKLNFRGSREGDYHLFRVDDRQYFVLAKKEEAETKTDGVIVGFHIRDVDKYFEQVTAAGLEPIDYLRGGQKLERPVWRDWGSKEFAVKGPEGAILVFAKME